MPVRTNPTSVIKARLGIEPNGRVQRYFTKRCADYMDRFVPRSAGSDGGNLRENISIGYDTITYESPYAHAQYVGYTTGPVRNYTTPGTGPYWDKRMWSVHKHDIINEVQAQIGGNK